MRPFYNFPDTALLTSYLRGTLIPDLIESGSDATAQDFADCATHIEQLTETIPQRATPRYAAHGVIVSDSDTGYTYDCGTAPRATDLARKLNK